MCGSEHVVMASGSLDACIVNLFKAQRNKCFLTEQLADFIFGGPCIMIHSYNKTNEMH